MDFAVISPSLLVIYNRCPRCFKLTFDKEAAAKEPAPSVQLVRDHTGDTLAHLLEMNYTTKHRQTMAMISFDDAPQTPASPLIALSPSGLGQFKSCKQAFKWDKIEKREASDRISLTPFQFGSLVHNTMDDFWHGLQDTAGSLDKVEDLQKAFVDFYQSDATKKIIVDKLEASNEWQDPKEQVFRQFYEALQNDYKYFKDILDNRILPGEDIHFNHWIGTWKNPLPIEQFPYIRLQGEIDYWFVNKRGNLVIGDRKTSKNTKYLDYDQLYIYALGLVENLKAQGKDYKVETLEYHLVRTGEVFTIPYGEAQKEALAVNLETLSAAIETNSFPASPSDFNCKNCKFRSACGLLAKKKAAKKAAKEQANPIIVPPVNSCDMDFSDLF